MRECNPSRTRFITRCVLIETTWLVVLTFVIRRLYGSQSVLNDQYGLVSFILWSTMILSQLVADWIERERGDWQFFFLSFTGRFRLDVIAGFFLLAILSFYLDWYARGLLVLNTIIGVLGRIVSFSTTKRVIWFSVSTYLRYCILVHGSI